MNKSHIYVYDLESESFAFRMFNVGRGRNELISFGGFWQQGDDLMFQGNQGVIGLDSIYEGCDREGAYREIKDLSQYFFRFTSINDDMTIATGVFSDSDKQFAILDKDYQIIDYFDDYLIEVNGFTSKELAWGLQGKLASHSNGFVHTSSGGAIFKFFELKNSIPTKTNEYIIDIPEFKLIDNSVAKIKENVHGVVSIAVAPDRYYMLYNYSTVGDYDSECDTIFCFSHDGTPIEIITLEQKVELITYNQKYNTLYGVGIDSEGLSIICKIEL